LAEGGILDQVLARSPLFGKLQERLSQVETQGGHVQQSLGQIVEQLNNLTQALQAPSPSGEPGAVPDAGSLGPWAPLLTLFAQKALTGSQPPVDPLGGLSGAVELVAKFLGLYNQIQATTLKGIAEANKLFREAVKHDVGDTLNKAPTAHVGAE
jgi:hypothetical protein